MMEEPYLPQEVTGLDMAFGGSMERLTIPYESIPMDFRSGRTKWNEFQKKWFFKGIEGLSIEPKKGIDHVKALRHLRAIQGSFDLKHEHKEAIVAYFSSLWFDDVKWE